MRAELLLSQPKMGRGARLALLITAGGAGLYSVVLSLLLWNMNVTLKRDLAEVKTTRQQAAEGRAARRFKRQEATRVGIVRVALPGGSGTADFTEEMYGLASASGTEMLSVVFSTSGQTATPPPTPPPGSDNGNISNNVAGNGTNSNAPAPPPVDSNGDDTWKRAAFECNVVGSSLSLQDFLDRVSRLPRVVEISGIELNRDRVDTRTGVMRVHLKLTGSIFGQADKP